MASSRFDAAWAVSDTALAAEMGEVISIAGVEITAVVSEVTAGSKIGGMGVVNSGIAFVVYLSRAQLDALVDPASQGALSLKGKAITRGQFKGRVHSVLDLGGGGAELNVEPLSSR